MFSKLMTALDATVDFGLTTIKKIVLLVVLAAVVASLITASIMFAGFNAIT